MPTILHIDNNGPWEILIRIHSHFVTLVYKSTMSCLALSLQPANGPDILLQTREWFPPARALLPLLAFRQTRLGKNQSGEDGDSSLGDDPLAASSGQVIVGVESRYRVVYRLVNGIYVLGITTVDEDNLVSNVFDCIGIVNQAVSVVVAACRGVDVTPEKLSRKYAEIYLALDIVLRGVSNIRLAAMLASMHGDGIAKMVHSAMDTENKIRGAESWINVEYHSIEHEAGVESFSAARFELPAETLAFGDDFAAAIALSAPISQGEQQDQQEKSVEDSEKDPFAASDAVNEADEIVSGFKKVKDPSATDLSLALAGLEVTALPPAEAAQSTFIGVEGFEGDYGGIEFNNSDASSLTETFEGFHDAFGGGLDASEFVGSKKGARSQGLGGLEFLQTGQSGSSIGASAVPLEDTLMVEVKGIKGPEVYVSEEISAEFRESVLVRVGFIGVVYLKAFGEGKEKEAEFSFRVDGTAPIKRFVSQDSCVSNLGNGLFHVRARVLNEHVPILKYSLLPSLTPIPMRVRLLKRHSGTQLSVMIQYAANPDLASPLNDVTFILKLPVDPSLLMVSPKGILNRAARELRWNVSEVGAKGGSPGRLRARMAVEGEGEVCGYVKFCMEGSNRSVSGVSLGAAAEGGGKAEYFDVGYRCESGVYMCN